MTDLRELYNGLDEVQDYLGLCRDLTDGELENDLIDIIIEVKEYLIAQEQN